MSIPILNVLPIVSTSTDRPEQQRALFTIVWSCLSTVILCAWTSVHPNVPPPNRWKARWNRLRLMFWMVISPELVLAWAVRQFFAAREIRDKYNDRQSPGTSLSLDSPGRIETHFHTQISQDDGRSHTGTFSEWEASPSSIQPKNMQSPKIGTLLSSLSITWKHTQISTYHTSH